MRTLIFILFISLFSHAGTQTPALVDSDISLKNYNHRPSVKMQHAFKLKRLVGISPTKAKEITLQICKEPVVYQKLRHQGQLLFYISITKHCTLKINALDGTIISKVHK